MIKQIKLTQLKDEMKQIIITQVMNSSSLSPQKSKPILNKNSSMLPPISSPSSLKYHNDYQSYQDQLHEFKVKKQQQNIVSPKLLQSSSPSVSKNNSSSISSSSSSQSSLSNKSPTNNTNRKKQPLPSQDSPSQQPPRQSKLITPYQQSPNFWHSSPYHPSSTHFIQSIVQYSEHQQYKHKPTQQIQKEIRHMRKQLQEMNANLSQRLDQYHMAKSQFVSKQLTKPSRQEFYSTQLQTNKKVEAAQLAEIKKLNSTQLLVKDKDVLIDLQNILIEMKQQLHQGKKQQHDSRLKNHKQDLFLNQIIKTNIDNKDNNQVKLLKLQIIYYMKKQNSLKTYQQQLDHEQKLINQNQHNLNLKIQQIKQTHPQTGHLWDQNGVIMKQKYTELVDKKKNLQKFIQTFKKSHQVQEEKIAREILDIDRQLRKVVGPKIFQLQETNYQLESKINAITIAYQLNESALKDIKYKFLQDSTYSTIKPTTKKPFLKPNLRPKSKIEQSPFITQRPNNNNNTKSNQKLPLPSQRYNDKNISMTIDANLLQNESKMRNISQVNHLKPRNFRILSKRENQNITKIDKHSSFSTTIEYGSAKNIEQKGTDVQTARLLKPNLLLSKGHNTKR